MSDVVSSKPTQSIQGAKVANATWEYVSPHFLPTPDVANATIAAGPSMLERLAAQDSVVLRMAEPYFAPIGHIPLARS